MNRKAIWKREETRGGGWTEHEVICEYKVEILGFVHDGVRVFAVCDYYGDIKAISISELKLVKEG